MAERHGQEWPPLRRATVKRLQLDISERHERTFGRVQVVGRPAAVPVAGQAEHARDPVAVGLDHDALVAVLHEPRRYPPCPPGAAMLGRMADPRWWYVRRAQNLKPATYRCPLCGRQLPALSEHLLLFPE